ncbi:TIR domain-containing adapter molecule 1 [Apteryx mantelli]|uniref:TIR domain-containing adapter molecule 1 n=1 Tax=Apteryx mantelli TaxID=2696672 RepID=A0A8B7IIP7_9AVES
MAQSAEVQPSFEDIFNILSQIPEDKLLNLKYKLKHLISTPSSKLLQAMVLLTLGQEADARICLDTLRNNQAALYIHRTKLGTTGVQEDGEDLQPPQLDADAMALLARIYSLLVDEKLCSWEAMVRAYQMAIKAFGTSGNPQEEPLKSTLAEAQEKCGAAIGFVGSGGRFQMMRSDTGFLQTASPNFVARSSPVQIGSISDLSGPRTLRSSGSPASFISRFEISESPTAVFRTQSPRCDYVPQPSRLCGEPTSCASELLGESESHGLQETSWPNSPSSYPAQGATAHVPRPEQALQASSCHPSLPIPETQLPTPSAVNQAVESSDVSSTVTAEPQAPKGGTAQKQEDLPTCLPDSRATAPTGPIHTSVEDVPEGTSFHTTSPASACSLPPHSSSFSSAPPLQAAPPNLAYHPSLPSSSFPACPPPVQTAEAASTLEPDGEERKFFTFVVLHASEDVDIACRVKKLLESMGVPNGATFCEDFLTGGRGQLSCFQDAMENSAFTILLLTKNFLCQPCMFQTNSALMESILRPSKHNSVVPFVPRENPLERRQIPTLLSGLVSLDENSPVFAKTVRNTFTPSKISELKAMWEQIQHVQEQKRKLQLYQDHCQTLKNLAELNLGSPPQVPLSAPQPNLGSLQQLLEQLMPHRSPQQCHFPMSVPPATYPPPSTGHSMPAQQGSSPSQTFYLPSGYHNMMQGPGGAQHLIIQHARMVQIGNHNMMHVQTAPSGPKDSEEETSERP